MLLEYICYSQNREVLGLGKLDYSRVTYYCKACKQILHSRFRIDRYILHHVKDTQKCVFQLLRSDCAGIVHVVWDFLF